MPYSDRQSKRKGCLLLFAFTTVGAVVGIWLLSILLFPGPYTSAFPRAFDSAAWKKADTWGDARCAMIVDLRFRIGVKGRSRADIERLLGPPEDHDNQPDTSHWHLCPSFMDIWILEVRWRGDLVVEDWVRDT